MLHFYKDALTGAFFRRVVKILPLWYYVNMFISEYFMVFPEGDVQEIQGRLPFNALVDMNGHVLHPPLPTNKMIVYKVAGIKTDDKKGSSETYHFLELLGAEELLEYLNEER